MNEADNRLENICVAVIVPVYNVEKYIVKCLDTVIKQTYKNLEIILVDDGSIDKSGNICEEYAATDKRVKVYHNENHGLSYSRNFGVGHSMASYIIFVDSDDYLELDCVEYLMNLITKYNVDIACCDTFKEYISTGEIRPAHQDEDGELYLQNIEAVTDMFYNEHFDDTACAKMYDRKVWDNIHFPEDIRIAEEAATTYRVMLEANAVAIGLKCKYHYVMRSGGITRGKFTSDKMIYQKVCKECLQYIYVNYPAVQKAAKRYYIAHCFWILHEIPLLCKQYANEVKLLEHEIKLHQLDVMMDKRASLRDKIAILSLMLGFKFFALAWEIYARFTGRK